MQLKNPRVLMTHVLTTRMIVLSVYEDLDKNPPKFYSHSTLMRADDGDQYGKVGTRVLPPELDALPAMTGVRSNACLRFHNAQYEAAYAEVYARFPELKLMSEVKSAERMGEVCLYFPDVYDAVDFYCDNLSRCDFHTGQRNPNAYRSLFGRARERRSTDRNY